MSEEVQPEKVDYARWKNRRKMAWLAMASMVCFTGILLTPFITDERINSLAGVFDAFYFAMASVVGAYMGFTTWASRKQ